MAITVGVRELKRDLSGYLKRAAAGEHIRVSVRGRPTVELTAIPADAPEIDPFEAELDRLVALGKMTRATAPKGTKGFIDIGLDYSPTERILQERAEEDIKMGIPPRDGDA